MHNNRQPPDDPELRKLIAQGALIVPKTEEWRCPKGHVAPPALTPDGQLMPIQPYCILLTIDGVQERLCKQCHDEWNLRMLAENVSKLQRYPIKGAPAKGNPALEGGPS